MRNRQDLCLNVVPALQLILLSGFLCRTMSGRHRAVEKGGPPKKERRSRCWGLEKGSLGKGESSVFRVIVFCAFFLLHSC